MSNKEKPIRPFSLDYADAKSKIYKAVNEAVQLHGVPFYLLEDVLADLSRSVKERANLEREKATRDYEQKLAEYEKNN